MYQNSTQKSNFSDQLFNQLLNNNPQFRKFVEENKGKTPEQIAKEHNIDLDKVLKTLK